MILLLTTLIVLLFAVWNGFVINWEQSKKQNKRKYYNDKWHKIGAIVRILVILIPMGLALTESVLTAMYIGFFLLFISHTLYNVFINLTIKESWDYLSGKGFDKIMLKKVNSRIRIYHIAMALEAIAFIVGVVSL